MDFETNLKNLVKEAVREVIREVIENGLLQPRQPPSIHKRSSQAPISKPRDPNAIIRPTELCDMLRVSRATLWRLENKGQLPPRIQLTSRAAGWRYRDIEQWISQREVKSLKSEN